MFGKRGSVGVVPTPGSGPSAASPAPPARAPALAPAKAAAPPPGRSTDSSGTPPVEARKPDKYYETKSMIFGALIDAIDLSQLAKLDGDSAREEIRDIVNEIIG